MERVKRFPLSPFRANGGWGRRVPVWTRLDFFCSYSLVLFASEMTLGCAGTELTGNGGMGGYRCVERADGVFVWRGEIEGKGPSL